MFHLRKAFALRGPIQNEESGIPCRRNDYFFTTPRQKVWKRLVDPRNHMRKRPQAFGKFFQNGTFDGSILPPLEASRPLPTMFVGSSMGFVFLGKSDWLQFVQAFLVCASVTT